jgi:hypothetical protein
VLNRSFTVTGSLMTTVGPQMGKLKVYAGPYRRPAAAITSHIAATNAAPCTIFGNRTSGGSRTGSEVAVAMYQPLTKL